MPLLLNIDTATEHASVCLSKHDTILGIIESVEQKNHASFVQPAIEQLMKNSGYTLSQLDAIAVTSGPGSYTGLRVGLASAKGICYALQKKLVLVNTLEVMAQAILSHYKASGLSIEPSTLLCPLIDARRMEVFTALYDISLKEITAPFALIIDENTFDSLLKSNHSVIFSGSGHQKLKEVIASAAGLFSDIQHNASHLAIRAVSAYQSNRFADLAYSEPLYVKEFFDTRKKA
ncbi:MAG: tRNA (adenosine(37)-N6)-threonylcarbamoyltransferase complex dimerization subunit type 1 TsaB [Sediminibacterium sp.]